MALALPAVMLRITKLETETEPRLLLEGRITGDTAADLAKLSEAYFASSPTLALDLSGVSFADQPSAQLLNRLRTRGAVLEGCSGFLVELLRSASPKPKTDDPDDGLIAALRNGDENGCWPRRGVCSATSTTRRTPFRTPFCKPTGRSIASTANRASRPGSIASSSTPRS